MHRLLILSRHAKDYLRLIHAARLPGLDITAAASPQKAVDICPSCDIVFGEPSLVSGVIMQLPDLCWVQSTWAGVEPLLDPALRRDYVLTNARGVFGGLMSEYVFAYLLANERRILERHAAQAAGQWDKTPPGTLRGKKIGLMGVGSIGADLARTARHFGMTVRGYTRSSEACAEVDQYYHGTFLTAFASELDYLVNILPDTGSTRRIVDAALLSALPQRAVFVNVGRGSTVDEAALAEALQAGRIAGAVLDVFQEEPLAPGHILWRTPNVRITFHTAAMNVPEDIAGIFLDNYRRLLQGDDLRYRVDFERGY